MKHEHIKYMTLAAVFAAIVFVLTAYVHVPVYHGYTHVGDGIIYLAACLLPAPYAIFTGAVGALLADCLTGFALWAPASVVIKALTALCFTAKRKNILSLRNVLALLPACFLCVGGYYLYEGFVYGDFTAALAAIPGNLIQVGCSALLFLLLSVALDRLHFKSRYIA